MKPSAKHKNRKKHNWLVYDIGDRYLLKYATNFKGVLYDLGCGEAVFKSFFLKFADKYVGVDWSESQHNINTDITADLNKELPIEDAVADTVTSISVMEHLKYPQVFLRECNRILKPGGFFLLQVPWQWHIHEAPHDFFRYTPYALEFMLEDAGFSNIRIEPSSGFFTTIIIKFNYFSIKLIRGPVLIKKVLSLFFMPIWYLSQKVAPYLDRLDKNWEKETQGYYVSAEKAFINP